MFLNITEFKKFLKTAYKGSGLIVGVLDGNLILTNSSRIWGVQVDGNYIPNKLKAALVELIGDLPEEGEVLNYTQDAAQAEMNLGEFDFYHMWMRAGDYAAKSPIVLKNDYEEYVLMQVHSTMEMRPLYRDLLDIISAKDLEHAIEDMPVRPSFRNGVLYWKNDTTIYWACTSKIQDVYENEVLPRLEFLDCFGTEIKVRRTEQLPYDEED